MSLRHLKLKIEKDKKYKMLKATLTKASTQFDAAALRKEIETLHSARVVRRLNPSNPKFINKVIAANTEDIGVRSRLAEILLRCAGITGSIVKAIDAFKSHCELKYSKTLGSFRTKSERESALDSCLSDIYEYLSDLELIENLANIVIKDVDQAGFGLKRNVDAIGLHFVPERKL